MSRFSSPARGARTARHSRRLVRDEMMIALTDRATFLTVVEATHSASSWSSSAVSSSQSEVKQGLGLIEAERARLEARLSALHNRGPRAGDTVAAAAAGAEQERVRCRLRELGEHADHLNNILGRIRPEVEVESVEWQRPLVLQDGSVAGFVDLWATVRVTSYRIAQGQDPWDHESRPRYEGVSVHHLIRSIAVVVEPAVDSLSDLVRRVRFILAHAKNALPLVVTCAPVASGVLAGQGIPTYVWSPSVGTVVAQPALPSPRRARKVAGARARVAPQVSRPQLPGPRASLPPAPRA